MGPDRPARSAHHRHCERSEAIQTGLAVKQGLDFFVGFASSQ
jgi:hypothetical protein